MNDSFLTLTLTRVAQKMLAGTADYCQLRSKTFCRNAANDTTWFKLGFR